MIYWSLPFVVIISQSLYDLARYYAEKGIDDFPLWFKVYFVLGTVLIVGIPNFLVYDVYMQSNVSFWRVFILVLFLNCIIFFWLVKLFSSCRISRDEYTED